MARYIYTAAHFAKLVLGDNPRVRGEEGLHLDFKRDHAVQVDQKTKSPARDTAIDLAALANAEGGVVVFGVEEEQKPGAAANIGIASGLTPGFRADASAQHVEQAIEAWTRGFVSAPPRPLTLAVPGGAVVVVNVYPADRLVSVRGNGEGTLMSFPIRTTFGNAYLRAEEIHLRTAQRGWVQGRLQEILRDADAEGTPIRLVTLLQIADGSLRANEWPFPGVVVAMLKPEPHGLVLRFQRMSYAPVLFRVPYSWIVEIWEHKDESGRGLLPALFVAAILRLESDAVVAVPCAWPK